MKHRQPPKLPPRPPSAIRIYKTLPDASKADLPPKPVTTPTSSSPIKFHFQQALIPTPSPSPNRLSCGQKRPWSRSTDNVPVPLPNTPTPIRIKDMHFGSRTYHSICNYKVAGRAVKTRRIHPGGNSGSSAYNNYQYPNDTKMLQPPKKMSDAEAIKVKIQLIHNKLLGGASVLTARDQAFLQNQMDKNPASIPALMMKLIIRRVPKKPHNLSYGIMRWAHRRSEGQLLEDLLTDRLYNFDVKEALDEGLMSVHEMSDLIDCQLVLQCVQIERAEQVQGRKSNYKDTGDDQYESDSGSVDMEMSEDD
ncbi:hypothetical protein EKO27_g3320 [Xylaria grammica]|uniref:Uncharacterized protein n=1 Tax=Xylaria grammica TaxID=363999 RepID=A0A439DBN7_9PEZI|nr:hypothetical protein EKO27_g3320 [Xylaria grammica]